MDRPNISKLLSNVGIPTIMAVAGLLTLLVGYWISDNTMITLGWIFAVFGAGWLLITMRVRTWRLP